MLPEQTRKSFTDFNAAYDWANALINAGLPTQASRLRADYFKSFRPRDRAFKVLGFTRPAAKACKRIEPIGEFLVEIEQPGVSYYCAGLLDLVEKTTSRYRFSCWYSRFLPYAVAMLRSEHGFAATGIDFESVNSYFGTCMGFHYLGDGDGFVAATETEPEYHRICAADVELYQACYAASMEVMPPSLPFDEVHRPCMVYTAVFKPQLIAEMVGTDHWWIEHVNRCFEAMGRPRPEFSTRRAA